MTPEQKLLVQTTYNRILPLGDAAGELFYNHLFEVYPAVQKLFLGTVNERAHSLMTTLTLAIRSLDDLDSLILALRRLGVRHHAYGVLPEHYPMVGDALLWTLGQALGEDFTPDVRDAWSAAYGLMADTMQTAVPVYA